MLSKKKKKDNKLFLCKNGQKKPFLTRINLKKSSILEHGKRQESTLLSAQIVGNLVSFDQCLLKSHIYIVEFGNLFIRENSWR